jgi:hypothetical protein
MPRVGRVVLPSGKRVVKGDATLYPRIRLYREESKRVASPLSIVV